MSNFKTSLSAQKVLSSNRLGAAESQDKNEHPTDMATRSRASGAYTVRISAPRIPLRSSIPLTIRRLRVHAGSAWRLESCWIASPLIRHTRSQSGLNQEVREALRTPPAPDRLGRCQLLAGRVQRRVLIESSSAT
jgi:hypothetical protein